MCKYSLSAFTNKSTVLALSTVLDTGNSLLKNSIISIFFFNILDNNPFSKTVLSSLQKIVLNRIINGQTTSISFKYIEEFCYYLNCTPGDLMTLININND